MIRGARVEALGTRGQVDQHRHGGGGEAHFIAGTERSQGLVDAIPLPVLGPGHHQHLLDTAEAQGLGLSA